MTTTTHSHKHWTDKGGHVRRSEDANGHIRFERDSSARPWIRDKKARSTAALQNFIRYGWSSSGPGRVRFFIGCAATTLRDPTTPRLEAFWKPRATTAKAAAEAIRNRI